MNNNQYNLPACQWDPDLMDTDMDSDYAPTSPFCNNPSSCTVSITLFGSLGHLTFCGMHMKPAFASLTGEFGSGNVRLDDHNDALDEDGSYTGFGEVAQDDYGLADYDGALLHVSEMDEWYQDEL